jgi:hypothetical protein
MDFHTPPRRPVFKIMGSDALASGVAKEAYREGQTRFLANRERRSTLVPSNQSRHRRAKQRGGNAEAVRRADKVSRFTLYLLILLAIGAIVFAITNGLDGGFTFSR